MIPKNTKEYIKNKKNQGLYGLNFIDAIHPGATLQEEIDFFGLTQKELAKKIGYSIQTVNRIVKGRESINTDIALSLERVFGGRPSAQFWLNIQADYNKKMSKLNELKETQKEMKFFKAKIKNTFKELQKGGVFSSYVLNNEDSYKKSIIKIKDFFGSYSLQSISGEVLLGVPFRKYDRKKTNQYNLAAILKIGEKKAIKILREKDVKKYDKNSFTQKLEFLRTLNNKKPKEFLELLQKECLEVGVVVVYVPNMTNTGFGGATIWIGDYPVVLLKVEKQWEDIFWFNFFHEAGHILKHSRKEISINFNEKGEKEKNEIEADEFAGKILIPNFDEINKQVGKRLPEDKWIEIVSKKTGVSKSIIAGRLCNTLSIEDIWKKLDKYRPTIKEKISFV
ncbi:HigA family addiction module antidote protein [Patescibacteria group bacterium]|nr:HigA family addiction module antidote protein [Patescibacteria group bacterium]MCG2695215.1 HigA family addiction module antitoxin [Candidatus Parcubacteria bacterium]